MVNDAKSLKYLKSLQRMYQLSPSDAMMSTLLKSNIDSAHAIIQYEMEDFVNLFEPDLKPQARLAYSKSHQVHNAILNMSITHQIQKTAPWLSAFGSNSRRS